MEKESRAVITAPRIVGWMKKETYLLQVGAHPLQVVNGSLLHGFVGNIDVNPLALGNTFYERCVDRKNGFNFTGPGRFFVRPT